MFYCCLIAGESGKEFNAELRQRSQRCRNASVSDGEVQHGVQIAEKSAEFWNFLRIAHLGE